MHLTTSSGRHSLQWGRRCLLQSNLYNNKYNNFNNNCSSNLSRGGNGGGESPLLSLSATASYQHTSLLASTQSRHFHATTVALRTKPRTHKFKLARWMRRMGKRRMKGRARSVSVQDRKSLLYSMLREEGIPLQDMALELPPSLRTPNKTYLRQINVSPGMPLPPKYDPSMLSPKDDISLESADITALAKAKRLLDEQMGLTSDSEKREIVDEADGIDSTEIRISKESEQQQQQQQQGHQLGQYTQLNADGELPVVEIPMEENRLWLYLQDTLKREDIEVMDEEKLLQEYTFDEYIGVMKHRMKFLEGLLKEDSEAEIEESEAKTIAVKLQLIKDKMHIAFIKRLKPIDPNTAPTTDNTFIQWIKENEHKSLEELQSIPYDELIKSFKLSDVVDSMRYLSEDDAFDLQHILKPLLTQAGQEITVQPPKFHDDPDAAFLDMLQYVKERANKDGEQWDEEASEIVYGLYNEMWNMRVDLLGAKEKLRKSLEQVKTSHPTTEMREKMWQLHVENPHYWTGERLARAFGIDRDEAWILLIAREISEAKKHGLSFNHHKTRAIFRNAEREARYLKYFNESPTELQKKRRMLKTRNAPYGMTMNEEEAYKYFLDETEKALPSGGGDDLLPDWAKLPFQEPNITEDKVDEPLKVMPTIPSDTNLGSDLPRSPISFIEATTKDIPPSERLLMVKQVDGILREMSKLEKEIAFRRGSLRKTKMGLGGRARRRRAMRQRRF